MVMTGLPEMPIQNIRIRDAHISATTGVRLRNVRDLSFERVVVRPAQGALYDFKHCSGITIDGAGYREKSAAFPSDLWRSLMHHDEAWFTTPEAAAVTANVLFYQCAVGGWPKNIDMARQPTAEEKVGLVLPLPDSLATIDSGATGLSSLSQRVIFGRLMRFVESLAAASIIFCAVRQRRLAAVLSAASGYFFPRSYNDNAMISVLDLLQDIAEKRPGSALSCRTSRPCLRR